MAFKNKVTEAWYYKDHEKSKERQRVKKHRRYHEDPEYRAQVLEYSKWARREREFGITREAYAEMEAVQGGRCAICGEVPEKSLHIDHDHKTGQVRGLLCGHCNRGLGLFRDDPDRLKAAARYLK